LTSAAGHTGHATPVCIDQYLEDLLDALWGALDLARNGPLDERIAAALRSANDLLDVVQKSVIESPGDFAALGEARDRLNAAGALFALSPSAAAN